MKNPKLDKVSKLIDAQLLKVSLLASAEIERLARKVLREHKSLKSFTMAMGTFFFEDHKGNVIESYDMVHNWKMDTYTRKDTFLYFKPLNDFIMKWDEELKVTGDPMHFTATGEKITEW